MKWVGIYSVAVGVMMVGQWVFFLAMGQVPELQTEPWRIGMHLAAEFITAIGLIFSGLSLIRNRCWGMRGFLVFAGMLVYSVIASPGYFAQQGNWVLVGMFAILLFMTIISIWLISKKSFK